MRLILMRYGGLLGRGSLLASSRTGLRSLAVTETNVANFGLH